MSSIQPTQGSSSYGNTPLTEQDNRVRYNKETRTFSPIAGSKPKSQVQVEGRIAKMHVPVDLSSPTFLKGMERSLTFTGAQLKNIDSFTLSLSTLPQSTARF